MALCCWVKRPTCPLSGRVLADPPSYEASSDPVVQPERMIVRFKQTGGKHSMSDMQPSRAVARAFSEVAAAVGGTLL